MAKKKAVDTEVVEENGDEDPIEFTPSAELQAVADAASETPAEPTPEALPVPMQDGTLASDYVDADGNCVVRDIAGTKHVVKADSLVRLSGMNVKFPA